MTRRQTALIAAFCSLLVFVALATVLNTWQTVGDALTVWLTVIGEGLR